MVFTGGVCADCAGVWSEAQRAAMAETQLSPFRERPKAREFKSPEDRYKAARGSKLENIEE